MTKTALITGASSGIGYACAESLAAAGYQLIITARRKERIEKLADELINKYQVNVLPVVFDIRNKDEVFSAIAGLPDAYKKIDLLVNNAGLALGLSEIHGGDTDDWDQMLDTNVKGLLYVSRAVIPGMIDRKQGHIINIGSIAGKETYPKGNVYCASKHAVTSLSKAMRMELVDHNIKVTLVNPGAAETEFSLVRFKGDKDAANQVYKGFEPLHAEDIARCVVFCAQMPSHVNIDDMVVMATAQATASVSLFNRSDS
jgi:NADP-dependent 3-hydroxy acid dehydrogenase YdfG